MMQTHPSRHADRQLRCARCGDLFVYTAGEQELARLRGLDLLPDQCPMCRRQAFVPVPRR